MILPTVELEAILRANLRATKRARKACLSDRSAPVSSRAWL